MADRFGFQIMRREGEARRGIISTAHGAIDTPAFMPVGTRAAVKGLTPAQLAEAGVQVILANTYHLMLRPGADVIQQLGGLHRFMGWNGPVVTDSGGYQVFSLADLRQIDDDGAVFRSHLDGATIRLTPETSLAVQTQLGADLIMAFDECPPLPATAEVLRAAVQRTVAWARRSRAAHHDGEQALYGIVQGGLDSALRKECLERLVEIGFEGYALGGLSVGEPVSQMHAFLAEFTPRLPAERPRYVMGIGAPADLVAAVAAGADQFDCVLPTRNGRKGYAFTSQGVVRLRNACHRLSSEPLDAECACYACRHFSRGYLRHLFASGEVLGATLVSLHNVGFYESVMQQMRAALEMGDFEVWRQAFTNGPVGGRSEDEE